jgi:hypothetical protein
MTGQLLTDWTIRLALVCYAALLAGEIVAPHAVRRSPWFRLAWTTGCALFLAHVACAFHYFHHWSHSDAFTHTAQRTGEMVGFAFGAGIYFSYAFGLLWTADVAWWWISPRSYASRPWWLSTLLHGYLFFIAFNGAIVFEGGPTRWVGSAAALGLLVLLAARILGGRAAPSTPERSSPPPANPADACHEN